MQSDKRQVGFCHIVTSSAHLGCTDTPFLASCQCRTRVGHRNGYDSPDSGVRRVSSFFLFFRFSDTRRHGSDTASTRLRRFRHASSEEKKRKFRHISGHFGHSGQFRPKWKFRPIQDFDWKKKKKKSKSKSYLLLLGFVLFFLLIFFLILVSSSSFSSSSSFGFGLLPDYLFFFICVLAVLHLCLEFRL